MIFERIRDQRTTYQQEESRVLSSCSEYVKTKRLPGIEQALWELNPSEIRKFVRFALGSTGAIIERENGGSKCVACKSNAFENIFVHRICHCKAFEEKRKKLLKKDDVGETFLWDVVIASIRNGEKKYIPFL